MLKCIKRYHIYASINFFVIAALAVVVIILWMNFGMFFNIHTIKNDIKLRNLEKELLSVQIPQNTEIVETKSVLGKLNGNGNGMDYLATALIRSDLSEQDLILWYENKCDIQRQNTARLENKYLQHRVIEYDSLKYESVFDNYYVIYLYTSSDSDGAYDWRAH